MGPSCHDRIGISRVKVQCIKGLRRNCYFGIKKTFNLSIWSILRLWKLQRLLVLAVYSCYQEWPITPVAVKGMLCSFVGYQPLNRGWSTLSPSLEALGTLLVYGRSPHLQKNREERVFSSLRFSWGKREGGGGGRGRCTQANSLDSLPDFFWGEGGVCTQTLGTRLLGHAV